jgi:hypothetical protein
MLWVLLCSFLVGFLVYILIDFWLTMVKWTVLWSLGVRRGWSPPVPFMISLYWKCETWCLTTRIVILSSLVHQSTNFKLVLGSQVPFRIWLCHSDWPFPSPSRASLALLIRKFQIFHVAIFLCDSSTFLKTVPGNTSVVGWIQLPSFKCHFEPFTAPVGYHVFADYHVLHLSKLLVGHSPGDGLANFSMLSWLATYQVL